MREAEALHSHAPSLDDDAGMAGDASYYDDASTAMVTLTDNLYITPGSSPPLHTPPIWDGARSSHNQREPPAFVARLEGRTSRSDSVVSQHEDPDNVGSANGFGTFQPFVSRGRIRLLRRSSSTSTLGSILDEETSQDSQDSQEPQLSFWSEEDVDRLMSVYDQCVDEAAAYDTPFSGPPPSQLLSNIARACRRVFGAEWKHSLAATRTKCLALVKERLQMDSSHSSLTSVEGHANSANLEETPRPAGDRYENTDQARKVGDANATPKRRRLRRNDSMDFLPKTRNLAALTKLSDRLNASSEDFPSFQQYQHVGAGLLGNSARLLGGPPQLSHVRTSTDPSTSYTNGPPSAPPLSGNAPRLESSLSFPADGPPGLRGSSLVSLERSLTPVILESDNNSTSGTSDHFSAGTRPLMRTASGFLPSSAMLAAIPSLYALPSMVDPISHDTSQNSIFGASVSSASSYGSSFASSANTSFNDPVQMSDDGTGYPGSSPRKRGSNEMLLSPDHSASHSELSSLWSRSTTSLSALSDFSSPETPVTSTFPGSITATPQNNLSQSTPIARTICNDPNTADQYASIATTQEAYANAAPYEDDFAAQDDPPSFATFGANRTLPRSPRKHPWTAMPWAARDYKSAASTSICLASKPAETSQNLKLESPFEEAFPARPSQL